MPFTAPLGTTGYRDLAPAIHRQRLVVEGYPAFVIGASAVIKQALIRGAPPGSWLAQMLARKPRMRKRYPRLFR